MAHRRTSFRKYRKRLTTLLVVVGLLAVAIGVLFELASLTQMEYSRDRFIRVGLYFIAGGIGVLLLYGLFFALPDYLEDRRSGVASRRRAIAKAYQRPKPSPGLMRRADDGSILMVVLVLLGLVAAAALHAIVTSQGAQRLAAARLDQGLLRIAAIDAARGAMQQLADDPDLNIDHLGEPWAQAREYTDPAGITRLVRIADAHRGFDLNNLRAEEQGLALTPSEALAGIMIQGGDMRPGQRIQALRDWVDADAGGPSESAFYQNLDAPYVAADRMLYGWSELFRVDGWSPTLLEPKTARPSGALFDYPLAEGIDLIPAPRPRVLPVNLNTAHPVTLLGLAGLGQESLVNILINERRRKPFASVGFLAELLGREQFAGLSPYLDVRSEYFHIQATAYRDGRSERLHVMARRQQDGRVDAVRAVF